MAPRKKDRFKILLADDGSEHARSAHMLLGDLPFPPGCAITALMAFSPTQASDLSSLEEYLNQTCALLKHKGFVPTSELLLGSPAEKIVEYASEHKPDLIVVGAKGLRATLGILLGGVAQQVVEYACCPVLVVRAPYAGLQRLLLVTDGSLSSQQAVQYLGKLPLPAAAHLQVLNVLPPPPMELIIPDMVSGDFMVTASERASDIDTELQAQQEKDGQALVDATIATLQDHGLAASGILRRGDAATEIIEYVKQEKIDLIVTGSRGLNRIRSWVMGSVSRKLVHYSGCSVLVVRNTQPA